MKRLAIAAFLAALPALASAEDTVIGEASGNWAGPSNQGFFYRAELILEKPNGAFDDFVRLRIFQGTDAIPSASGAPQLDNPDITMRLIGVGEQRLETGADGALILATEGADETAEFAERIVIRFIDNQFTVVGYFLAIDEAEFEPYSCEADLWNGETVFNGARWPEARRMGFEGLNASAWSFRLAVERGACPPLL
jgi:hypothetical protein